MIRWGALTAGAAVVVGAALVTASSIPPKPPVTVVKGDEVKATVIGQKTGYFNMVKVMRDYKRAQTAVARLNDRKNRMVANLIGMKGMYIDLQAVTQVEKANPLTNPKQLDRRGSEILLVARQIEDTEREVNKLLNNQAAIVIGELHDELRATVAEMAHEHGLHAVLAFPDAVTPEDAENPQVKELRLKPPACQPFYLDPSVDYTDEVLQRLNAKFAVDGGK